MLWYYYGKNIPTQQLPAFEILEEWYALCEEEGLTHVRTHRAVRGSNTSSGAGGSSSGVGGGVPTLVEYSCKEKVTEMLYGPI